MTTETMIQEIEELEQQGWEADAAPRAVEKHYSFPSHAATVKFLIAVGQKAEGGVAMPSIRVENGTEVTVRIGRPTSAALTAEEIELAKELNVN